MVGAAALPPHLPRTERLAFVTRKGVSHLAGLKARERAQATESAYGDRRHRPVPSKDAPTSQGSCEAAPHIGAESVCVVLRGAHSSHRVGVSTYERSRTGPLSAQVLDEIGSGLRATPFSWV